MKQNKKIVEDILFNETKKIILEQLASEEPLVITDEPVVTPDEPMNNIEEGNPLLIALENFDLDNLDALEKHFFEHNSKSMSKAEALHVLINMVEGDFSQLSPELAEIAEKYVDPKEYDFVFDDQSNEEGVYEQIEEGDGDPSELSEKVKSFQTLSDLYDNIESVEEENNGDNKVILINIDDISDEIIINCCGGESVEDAQRNLMQGLHHDLEESGLGSNFDIEIIAGEVVDMTDATPEDVGDTFKNMTASDKVQIAKYGDEDVNNGLYDITIKIVISDEILGEDDDCEECKDKEIKGDDPTQKPDNLILGVETQPKQIKEMKKPKVLRLNENEFVKLLKKIVTESVPGIEITKIAQARSKQENDENLKNVDKKIKDYLSFDGNDNPEFPKPIGKGEVAARQADSEEQQEVSDERGRGPQDLDYNVKVGKKQKERINKAIEGDSTMGNQTKDAVGVEQNNLGKTVVKNIKRRQDNKAKEPIYDKEAVPVKTKPIVNKTKAINEDNSGRVTMNNLDWGQTTEERNENLKKYEDLKTDEEKQDFCKKLKETNESRYKSVNEDVNKDKQIQEEAEKAEKLKKVSEDVEKIKKMYNNIKKS